MMRMTNYDEEDKLWWGEIMMRRNYDEENKLWWGEQIMMRTNYDEENKLWWGVQIMMRWMKRIIKKRWRRWTRGNKLQFLCSSQVLINSYVPMLILASNFHIGAKIGLAQYFPEILAHKLAYCSPPSETRILANILASLRC